MFEFVYLWFFLLLPLPVLARHFLSAKKHDYTQVWIPLAQGLSKQQSQPQKNYLSTIIPWLTWLLLLIGTGKTSVVCRADPSAAAKPGYDFVTGSVR